LTDLGIPHVADNPYNGETNIGMVGFFVFLLRERKDFLIR